jgi:uncharacterized protein YaaQ
LQLLIAVVQEEDADRAIEALVAKHLAVTKIATFGGYLKTGNSTLFLAVEEEDAEMAIDLLEETCGRRAERSAKKNGGKGTIGGGVVFRMQLNEARRI